MSHRFTYAHRAFYVQVQDSWQDCYLFFNCASSNVILGWTCAMDLRIVIAKRIWQEQWICHVCSGSSLMSL